MAQERLTWASRNPERMVALQKYVNSLGSTWQPLLVNIAAWENKECWLLMAAALRQGIEENTLLGLLTDLRSTFGLRFWELPPPSENSMHTLLHRHSPLRDWNLAQSFAGICRSVSAYIRTLPRDNSGNIIWPAATQLWRDCGNIFFMGRSSPMRPKALWFIYKLTAPEPFGLGHNLPQISKTIPLPPSSGARRWLRLLGPGRGEWLAHSLDLERINYYNEFYSSAGNTIAACHAMEFFLQRDGQRQLCCRKALQSCANCSLESFCPGVNF